MLPSPRSAIPAEPGVPPSVWIGFAMMCLGMFMAVLDVQVVATSLPTIQEALDVEPDRMSWVQTAYLIAEVIAIPLTGFLTRSLGIRRMFAVTVSLFTLSSLGCALSGGFATLVAWRVLQGFSGGTLIPAVFSAVFLLFPVRLQDVATTLAGVLAVLAPTIGPIVGGWLTETYSWRWLFLINIPAGLISLPLALLFLPRERLHLAVVRTLDLISLAAMAVALAALILALKQAPREGWSSASVLGLLALCLAAAAGFVLRTLRSPHPVIELRTLGSLWFCVGCLLSFTLGIGLFGSVYMMPVFLAAAHSYGALSIGKIMLVTGTTQLLTAPLAVALEKRTDPRLLSAAGFLLFAIGLGLSAGQTPHTDFAGMFWPQVIRGVAIMLCLLPPTRMALGCLAPDKIPDASGLFNLMRNLGGAIGLALIDTVMFGRAPGMADRITERLKQGDTATAEAVGIPLDLYAAHLGKPLPLSAQEMLEPLVRRLALVRAMNEAWAMAAAITVATLAVLVIAYLWGRSRIDAQPVDGLDPSLE